MKWDFEEVPEINNEVVFNCPLPGQEFPGKHKKGSKAIICSCSLGCVDEDSRKLKLILILTVNCVGLL